MGLLNVDYVTPKATDKTATLEETVLNPDTEKQEQKEFDNKLILMLILAVIVFMIFITTIT